MTVRRKLLSSPVPTVRGSERTPAPEKATAPTSRKKDVYGAQSETKTTPDASVVSLVKYAATAGDVLGQVMELDLDHNGAIDHRDAELAHQRGTPFSVQIALQDGTTETLAGPERLAHAADVLTAHVRLNGADAPLPAETLVEPPGAALERSIADAWPALVRRSNNVTDLVAALSKSNLPAPDGKLHVWVPASDAKALATLRTDAAAYNATRAAKAKAEGKPAPTDTLEVEAFTHGVDWRELDQRKPGILYLPQPFVVPGGRFSEMYGWDSHFIGQGLIRTGRTDLARAMIENQVYQVEHFGKIPNSSRSYHLSRSQPPFLPRFALELYEAEPTPANKQLLASVAAAAEKELAKVWNGSGHRTPSGLSRFHDDATGPDLEVERNLTSQGVFAWPDPEADRAARATGWDLSHRFSDHAQHFEPVDLNSQLYAYEKDLATIERLVDGADSPRAKKHDAAAATRAEVMQQRMWNEQLGLFVDHDNRSDTKSNYESLATFAPLAAGWATPAQAKRVAENLPRFLEAGGLATSSRASREAAGHEALQWDWPNGWAPLQVIAVEGLKKYGFTREADEVAYRWCSALLDIAGANNGLLPEKLDVHHISADVDAAEYGNQGADRGDYRVPRAENPQGFGWTNASFVTLRQGLPEALKTALDRRVRPDTLFPRRS